MSRSSISSPSASTGGNHTPSSSILEHKVQRALEVRTDTPAMVAALDALAHLTTTTANTNDMLDSRSVRVAMERDALQQALLLQDELKHLVETVSQLRQGVSSTAQVAQQVSQAIHTNVVVVNNNGSTNAGQDGLLMGKPHMQDVNKDTDETVIPTLQQQQEQEEQEDHLAALLSDAFRVRHEAEQRSTTVNAFLEKFNLSEQHSYLLEHYNFEDLDLMGNDEAAYTGTSHHSDEAQQGASPEDQFQGMEFLQALERVSVIREQLAHTLGGTTTTASSSSSNDKLGATSAIRMMETLAQKQERAYERLYHWLQSYLQLASSSNAPTSSHPSRNTNNNYSQSQIDKDVLLDEALSHFFVRRALQTLQHVPAFYSHLLELVATARRSQETRRFLLALTSGYQGRPPMERKAHDPVTYVAEMLAFCHQSCSVQADVCKGLVVVHENLVGKPQEEEDEEEDTKEQEEPQEPEEFPLGSGGTSATMSAAELLAHCMSGMARPLKSRILQVLGSLASRKENLDDHHHHHMDDDDALHHLEDDQEGATARMQVSSLYMICGLLLFYRSILDKAVLKLIKEEGGDKKVVDNPLVACIGECLEEATDAYAASLRVYAAMLDSLTLLTGESEASLVHSMLVEISKGRAESPGFSTDVECPSQLKASLSLEFMAETLLEAILSSSKSSDKQSGSQGCKTLDEAVTLKVAVTTAKKAGLSTQVASKLDALISKQEQVMIDELVKEETSHVLDMCGLGSLMTAYKDGMLQVEGMTMAAHAGLSQEQVETSMKEFYSSLYSPPLPSFEQSIKDPVLRKMARSKIAANVVAAYKELYEAICSDKGGYEDLSFLGHSPEQVKTLFSV